MEKKMISGVWDEFCALVDRSATKCDFRRALNALLLKRAGPLTVEECRALMSMASTVPMDKRFLFRDAFLLLKKNGLLPHLNDIRIMIN